jgi:hypothetical protein
MPLLSNRERGRERGRLRGAPSWPSCSAERGRERGRFPRRLLPLLPLLAAGCAADPPRTLRFVITTDAEIPAELDEIRISITASRSDSGNVCEPWTRVIDVDRPDALPAAVAVEIGADYTSWAAWRIVGLRGGAEVFHRESRAPWPAEGRRDVEVVVERACFDFSCPAGEQCLGARCVGVPSPRAFDDMTIRDRGVPCDRAAAVEDVYVPDAGDDDAGADAPADGASDDASAPDDAAAADDAAASDGEGD